ncbi:uncharacterized protein LOC125646963 [Ostrea edulis]|uniref:uncharacterized protein LOC125646963 n=1 Tax=Ostrea edulis TaxID=37623 RepID=UPI00209516C2|nr:uncharacterized protein LOC125646963 [Ostrea edulis]XP_048729588.1 uncharacterized protein LOC125646963 [Ostrea edulis]
MMCRWNCVTVNVVGSQENGWRHYELYWKRNAALSKPSNSSSVWPWDSHFYHASYAVDGRLVHGISAHQCFLSNNESSPWFQVDLYGDYLISFLRLFYRMDMNGNEFHDISVQVSQMGSIFQVCGFFKGPGISKQVVDVLCKASGYTRFVRLQITAGSHNTLLLCEVEVYTLN